MCVKNLINLQFRFIKTNQHLQKSINMSCSVEGCSDKATIKSICAGVVTAVCDTHLESHLQYLGSNKYSLEEFVLTPNPETKKALLLHLISQINDGKNFRSQEIINTEVQIKSIQNHLESALEKIESDLKVYTDFMTEIIMTEEIPKTGQTIIHTLLQLTSDQAIKFITEDCQSPRSLLEKISRPLTEYSPISSQTLNLSLTTQKSEEEKLFEKKDRIYMDGCFDLMHSGHFNAIRQAKSLGKVLVVGVHSDSEITRNKGPPVMNEQERYQLVKACKWVDEVVEDAPYSPTIELLDSLNCMYAAHGDDLSINADGSDCMSILKRAGRCKIFKRTEGISTTTLVGKLLLMTREELLNIDSPKKSNETVGKENDSIQAQLGTKSMLTTSRRISEFSNKREPRINDNIVYIDGTFDLFHVGHVETLRRAKEFGNYLLVGVHDDQTVNHYKGSNYPIMSLHDRVMCVLSIKYVDEVIIGAPWVISKELITGFNIKAVAGGTISKGIQQPYYWRKGSIEVIDQDPYQVAKELDLYHQISSVYNLDTDIIISRIVNNRLKYFSKFERTSQREAKYVESKEFIPEA